MKYLLDGIKSFSVYVCMASLVAIFVMAAAEIVARNVFDTSTYVSIEACGYLVSIFTVFGASYCIATGRALSITLITDLPVIRDYGVVVRVLRAVLGAGVLAFAVYYFFRSMSRNYVRGTTSGTLMDIPLWVPELCITLGLITCVVAAILQLAAAPEPEGANNDGF